MMRALVALSVLLALAGCVVSGGYPRLYSARDRQVARDVAAISAGIRDAR